jgi:hypothetical protein
MISSILNLQLEASYPFAKLKPSKLAIENKSNLYHQLKDQLYADIERYRRQGKEELVRIISTSLEENC